MRIKRALLSVYDKEGLADFARGLAELGVELVSTGGTARALEEAGLAVTSVQEVTGFPELLEGRVKSLHPRIHGGILARRSEPRDLAELQSHGIGLVDLVAVNLYPFARVVAEPGCTPDRALEHIDIGGPALLRAAAKNYPDVIPVCRPVDYRDVLDALREQGDLSQAQRRSLAQAAFAHTAAYDAAIAAWLGDELPRHLTLAAVKGAELRYGENPHQKAALYRWEGQTDALAWAEPLQGKALSYNNFNDAHAALALAAEFSQPAAVAVKHATPCGVGTGATPVQAFARAREADSVSIFGGIVAFNCPVDAETAAALAEIFLEVVAAPDFTAAAREILAGKKNLRLLACPPRKEAGLLIRSIAGGLLVQQADGGQGGPWRVAGSVPPPPGWEEDARLAWYTAKHAKSNAIVVAAGGMTVGIGSGSTSRIGAARTALAAAGPRARGAVLASDGFIPFPDVVEAAAAAGIAVIVQPGGSKGDARAIEAADRLGVSMVFTGIRHFRH